MKAYISEIISQAIHEIAPDEAGAVLGTGSFDVSYPKAGFGDYASNAAMVLFKKFNTAPSQNPATFANMLAEATTRIDKGATFSKIESAGGFINFTLSEEYLKHQLSRILQEKENFGKVDATSTNKILVEYFQPNMAKPLHLGHLRTAIIGDSLFKLLQFTGHAVESDTHLGDWGTQFGLLLLAYKKWGDISVIEKDPIIELNKLYVRINAEIEADPNLREEGKQEFVKLEQGDAEVKQLWNQFRDWSWQEYDIIYDGLGVRRSDHDWPESFFADKMPAVIKQLKEKGLLVESQGAQIVDLSDYNMGVAIIVKSDGGTTYLLRDLATFIFRKQQGFAQQLYVVDNRQSHSLNQTFKILELLGEIQNSQEAIHIAYGFLSLPEGAMSTRKGTIIGANELITKTNELALEIIQQKNPDLANKEEVSKMVARAAIKYFDLSHNYKTDIVFTWEKALSFEGNTGPYLQYTHARIYGIFRKDIPINHPEQQGEENIINDHGIAGFDGMEIGESEQVVIRKLHQFEVIVQNAATLYSPNILCTYLFELAQTFNAFYQEVPILKESDGQKRAFRLCLIKATAQVLKNGLNLLGIEAPEEM